MKLAAHTFSAPGIVHYGTGVHDVAWMTRAPGRGREGRLAPCHLPYVSHGHRAFLETVDAMVAALPDGDDYLYGTTYYRVLDLGKWVPAGTWHYDTGLSEPQEVRNADRPVLRFTAAVSSGSEPVGNLFTRDASVFGKTTEFRPEDTVQPANGQVVMFSEGVDLHGRAFRDADHSGGRLAFYSATLYTPMQTPDLSCPALESLRR